MTTRRGFLKVAAGGGAVAAVTVPPATQAARRDRLIHGVEAACRRLAAAGWRELILKASRGGLDIAGPDLAARLAAPLEADPSVPGFADFAGRRGIEPGRPSHSLLYHALASPDVARDDLAAYPTLAEIEAVENYVYGVRPPSLDELKARAGDNRLALVVFALQYRPARDTVHGRHADLAFSRVGVARMGDLEPRYDERLRAFDPLDAGRPFSFRSTPQRFAAYIAMRAPGDPAVHGPQDAVEGDGERGFWIPLHKVFAGDECLAGTTLSVSYAGHYRNEKLKRFHRYMQTQGYYTDWTGETLEEFPFVIKDEMIASLSRRPEFGAGVVEPRPAPFVTRARFRNDWLSFAVPGDWASEPGVLYFSSGQILSGGADTEPTYMDGLGENIDRFAPEYISVRHRLLPDGKLEDLNQRPDMMAFIKAGGYRAQHFIDFSGDGWVDVRCEGLGPLGKRAIPAYSLVSPPDFFPVVSQRDLTTGGRPKRPGPSATPCGPFHPTPCRSAAWPGT